MTEQRGWRFPEQHLLPDAVVAFVDGELTPTANARVQAHAKTCPLCAAEIAAQRIVSSAVQSAAAPATPASLLAKLGAIPQTTDLPSAPDGLAVTDDGQMVVVQRPERVAGFGSSAPLGSSAKLGEGSAVLGRGQRTRRAAQGAGVVVSGLVLGALALVTTQGTGASGPQPQPSGGGSEVRQELPARFNGGSVRRDLDEDTTTVASTTTTTVLAPTG